jgi:transglutaminase-like putative cysteine protease
LKLRVGYELQYEFPQPTPVIAMLNIHFSPVADLAAPDHIVISPSVPISCYRDGFGNWCSRILAPAGHVRLSTDAVVTDSGQFDPVVPGAEVAVECTQKRMRTAGFLMPSIRWPIGAMAC